ncbi:S26 family signal peptidase [Desulfovibrio gilichinskyi]|uniref:Conjugative transfer signal peptidase TraF n=1 Tax=Desulfovibrio gilichinskyi TaxID=1519643 RepID=A0A1X7F318_9BACT|nr:S26 family signal peptidase [Desulfovibrio gilichinskyi]SMF44413.1 conjugative transfer signal peptidase TraF [Desulfovibrio gilichinskyi]
MKSLVLTLFFCHTVAIIFLIHKAGYRVNFTDSMPHGIYQIVPGKLAKGDPVTFSLREDNPYFQISLDRKYLGLNTNSPLLKILIGTAGDNIKISSTGVSVNNMLLPLSRQKDSARCGRRLPALLHSTIIPSAKGLAMSTYTENSFDGRYFGLVDVNQRQKVIPVFTFNPEDKIIMEYSCPKCGCKLAYLTPTSEIESRWICNGYPACDYWTSTPEDMVENVTDAAQTF